MDGGDLSWRAMGPVRRAGPRKCYLLFDHRKFGEPSAFQLVC